MKKVVFILIALMLTLSCFGFTKTDSSQGRILILGNSITIHSPDSTLEWYGNWGMAASSQSKDYVHLLIEKLKVQNKSVAVKFRNVASIYERKFWKFDTLDFEKEQAYHPDIIIIRLGENISPDSVKLHSLEASIKKLVAYIDNHRNHSKVLITTSFWECPAIDQQFVYAANKYVWSLVDLSQIAKDPKAMALGKFKSEGVSRHPSDFGMFMIYKEIWKSLKRYL